MVTFILACNTSQVDVTDQKSTEEKNQKIDVQPQKAELRIYSGRSEALVSDLFTQAEAELNIKLNIEYGKTDQMVTRMLTEGTQSPADIIFAQDSGHLGALSNRDMLAELSAGLMDGIQQQYRDDKNRWLATSGRLRVLVYNSEKYDVKDLPQSLEDLKDPKWKGKLGWAPQNGSFLAHLSAIRNIWGEKKTEEWLTGVQANNPKVYPKNSPQVQAVHDGVLDIGWVNHYYLHKKLDTKNTKAKNYSFPTKGDPGNIVMLAGMGIRKGSAQKENAEKLLKWMTSPKAQQWFVEKNFEYPTIPGIKEHPDVYQLGADQLANIPQSTLADIGPTKALLKKLGL